MKAKLFKKGKLKGLLGNEDRFYKARGKKKLRI